MLKGNSPSSHHTKHANKKRTKTLSPITNVNLSRILRKTHSQLKDVSVSVSRRDSDDTSGKIPLKLIGCYITVIAGKERQGLLNTTDL